MAVNIVLGAPDDQSPFWSELAGLFGIINMVQMVCKAFTITGGKVKVGCDGNSALEHIFSVNQQILVSKLDFDMLSAIWKAKAQCPVQ